MKFRLWDNDKRAYITDTYLQPGYDYTQLRRFVAELYTGTKDRNGKEIYEGDIVQYEDNFGTNQYPDMRTFTEEVVLVGGAFDPISEIPTGIVTVAGNIHENPELLKGES